MNMDWNLAGAVILSGLVIVFLILIILIGVVQLTGKITGSTPKAKPSAPAPSPASAPVPLIPITQNTSGPAPVPAVEPGISGETVAVISAAVAAMMDEQAPGVPYQVAGIQHARSARPVWGFAGMQQNTRPF